MQSQNLSELQIERLEKLAELKHQFEPYYLEFTKVAQSLPIRVSGKLFELIVEFAKLRTPLGYTPQNHTMAVFTELIVRVRGGVPYQNFIDDIEQNIRQGRDKWDVTLPIDGQEYRLEVKSSQCNNYKFNLNQIMPGCPAQIAITADIRPFSLEQGHIECYEMRATLITEAHKRGTVKDPTSSRFKGIKKVIEKLDLRYCEESSNHPVAKRLNLKGMSTEDTDSNIGH